MDESKRYEKLLEQYRNGGMSRRDLLRLVGFAGMAAGVLGGPMGLLSRHAMAAGGSIRYDGWGGTIDKALDDHCFKRFTQKTGVTVQMGSYGGMEEFLASVKAGTPGQYNVFFCLDEINYQRFLNIGYGTELDESKIPNLKNVIPSTIEAFRKISGGKISTVPYVYSVTIFAYNSKHIDKTYVDQAGINALIDPKYQGKIIGEDNWQERIWDAALQSNQDPNNIQDMDAVWDKIKASRDVVLKYYSSGAEQMQLFANDEAWLGDAWSGRVAVLQRQNFPIVSVVPKGSRGYIGNMFVLKGSPMDEAHLLLNMMLEPDVAIAVSDAMAYPTVLDPTKFTIPESITSLPGYDPTGKLENIVFQTPDYWVKNEKEWIEKYQRIVSR
jgi:spermidine/putrescine transport system substrate-binding protein